jgi:hypothetical protein
VFVLKVKPDFPEEGGLLAAEQEAVFTEMNEHEAKSGAAALIEGLGIPESLCPRKTKESEEGSPLGDASVWGSDISLSFSRTG